MGNDHNHFHYTPSSVGALMDPGFLRQAVHDADSPHDFHSEPMLPEPSPRWRVAVLFVVGACLHRLHLRSNSDSLASALPCTDRRGLNK